LGLLWFEVFKNLKRRFLKTHCDCPGKTSTRLFWWACNCKFNQWCHNKMGVYRGPNNCRRRWARLCDACLTSDPSHTPVTVSIFM